MIPCFVGTAGHHEVIIYQSVWPLECYKKKSLIGFEKNCEYEVDE